MVFSPEETTSHLRIHIRIVDKMYMSCHDGAENKIDTLLLSFEGI